MVIVSPVTTPPETSTSRSMPRRSLAALAAVASLALAGCATAPAGPVEVTRFVAQDTASRLGQGTIFVESAPGMDGDSLELAAYKSAVASELAKLGYSEASRAEADQVAQVRVERGAFATGSGRGPVNVGVGGSTGSYGSGVGLGIGINLGGKRDREQVETRLGVMIRDSATDIALWEGRASFSVGASSELAAPPANAATIAGALFREFPGNNGETIEVKVSE